MKARTRIGLLVLFMTSTLAFYGSAQSPTANQQEEGRKVILLQDIQSQRKPTPEKIQEDKQRTVRKTMLIDKQVITLLKVELAGDSNEAHIRIAPTSPNSPTSLPNPTLRIEMQDGSVQEIPLLRVKEVAVEQGGDIR